MNVAETPANVTAVAPVNALPLMVTDVPTGPLDGVKPVIDGFTLNGVALTAEPAALVTMMEPLVAPLGTVAVIWL